ncbi:hypothetical protein NAL32_10415 [Chryseobacterium sp. Ch-15]|uniref:Uncharacterized protein n=1 Tax=Chryseobacterium muglaense TaxID=2893752 RepID=A0A9Q3USC1_9FLAO|nr:hypothetical protein [Chryseobacterium muglaense]MBD3906166.1 hypothetical protein [Chryseobacterium muglaense]MCC9033722.1 hypothetical protein [Chryseobacterium muglaense]MCM2554797.1 hypothetical protein [Chryseobacterium muglaense]
MILLKKNLITFALIPVATMVSAQKKDSIPHKVIAFVTDKFPQARDLNIEFTQVTPYQFSPELYGSDLPENKIKSFQQVKANANVYFIKNRKWLLSASLNYRFTSVNSENNINIFSEENTNKGNFHYHSEAVNVTYFSKLFNKIAVYSATLSTDGSDQRFERIRGMVTGSLVLKANAKTKMTLGIAVLADPSTPIPALPIFTYEHKFDNGWVADVLLPKKVLVRKDIFSNGRISFGTEMDTTSFYLYPSGKTYEFRQLEINSGVIYEHHLSGNFIGTLKTGLRATPNSRIFEKQESPRDYIFESNAKPSFYFNLGISYNPFGKPRTK